MPFQNGHFSGYPEEYPENENTPLSPLFDPVGQLCIVQSTGEVVSVQIADLYLNTLPSIMFPCHYPSIFGIWLDRSFGAITRGLELLVAYGSSTASFGKMVSYKLIGELPEVKGPPIWLANKVSAVASAFILT